MKTLLLQLSLTIVLPVMTGCALLEPKETRYLQSAQDHATKEDVKEHLGSPRFTAATRTGDAVWIYQIYEIAPGRARYVVYERLMVRRVCAYI